VGIMKGKRNAKEDGNAKESNTGLLSGSVESR